MAGGVCPKYVSHACQNGNRTQVIYQEALMFHSQHNRSSKPCLSSPSFHLVFFELSLTKTLIPINMLTNMLTNTNIL